MTWEETVNFSQEDDKKDQHSRGYALFLQDTEAVREQLQQFDDFFRMMLNI